VRALGNTSSAARETEDLFGEYREGLLRYIRYHLDDRSEAEDIAQESFVRFYQARSREEEILQPKAWLFRVAHNLLVDLGRKKKPELLDEQGWLAVEGRMVVEPVRLDRRAEVARLPWHRLTTMELECLRLRSEGLKLREIGEVLDVSISTVVSYISRALTKLRPAAEEEFAAPDDRRVAAAL
jgi:RNA polymerase sigma-70 factor (ECF subfamily)